MNDATIKPCPFCGNEKVEVLRTATIWIRCDSETGCGAETQSHPTRAGAIRNWNRRAPSSDRVATVVYDADGQEVPIDNPEAAAAAGVGK